MKNLQRNKIRTPIHVAGDATGMVLHLPVRRSALVRTTLARTMIGAQDLMRCTTDLVQQHFRAARPQAAEAVLLCASVCYLPPGARSGSSLARSLVGRRASAALALTLTPTPFDKRGLAKNYC